MERVGAGVVNRKRKCESEHRRRVWIAQFRRRNGSVLVPCTRGWGLKRCAGGFCARCHSQPTLVSRGLCFLPLSWPRFSAGCMSRSPAAVTPTRKHGDSSLVLPPLATILPSILLRSPSQCVNILTSKSRVFHSLCLYVCRRFRESIPNKVCESNEREGEEESVRVCNRIYRKR